MLMKAFPLYVHDSLVFIVIIMLGSHLCRYALLNTFVTSQWNATLCGLNIHSAWYNFTYCICYWAEYFCWLAYSGKYSSFQGHHQCFYILIASIDCLAAGTAHCDFMSKNVCPVGHAEKMFHYCCGTEYIQVISD